MNNMPVPIPPDTGSSTLHPKLSEKDDFNKDISTPKLDGEIELPNPLIPRNMTPLKLISYSTSPDNKFLNARTEGFSTSQESTEGNMNRDSKKNQMSPRLSSHSSMDNEILELQCKDEGEDDERNTYSYKKFLKSHSCYDFIPNSSKIVVFDTKLKVKKAFFALVHNNIRSAPIWDCESHQFVGMLTITDFINILIRYYTSPLVKMWELEEHQIETWRGMSAKKLPPYLIQISPKECLYNAVEMLVRKRIHRLPVIDPCTGNALYILTHKKILRYIFQHLDDLAMPDFMGLSLKKLGIGSYQNVAKINPWTKVIEALHIFNSRGVSALPIVDENEKCVDLYSKFDVINLAAERTYNNLEITVQEALVHRQAGFEGVRKCYPSETLYTIIERIYLTQVHRLVVVDDQDKVLGIISLSDILKFLVIEPPKLDSKT